MKTVPFLMLAAAVLAATLVSGCGFAMRGAANLPPAMIRTHIFAPGGSRELVNELSGLLRGNGVEIVDESRAAARLEISRNQLARNVQSIGATARVREFVLVYQLEFRVTGTGDEIIVSPQTIEMERDYTFDQGEVLGAASEEEYLRAEMTRDMARRIIESIELASR